VEILTPAERADPLHIWKEHTNADGRKYYFNRITKVSTWTIPEDLKAAKEAQAAQGAAPVAPVAGEWVSLSDQVSAIQCELVSDSVEFLCRRIGVVICDVSTG
jgi:hypothetical protein